MKQIRIYYYIHLLLATFFLFSCDQTACEDVSCLNGGECVDGNCECLEGYEGPACQFSASDKFIGSFSVSYDCFSVPEQGVDILPASNANEVQVLNLGDYDCPNESLVLMAQVSNDSLLIESQTVCVDGNFEGYTIEGVGVLAGNILTIQFQATYGVDGFQVTDDCVATMEK